MIITVISVYCREEMKGNICLFCISLFYFNNFFFMFTGFWLGGPKIKRPLAIPGCRWEDNIKMDLRKIGVDGANWIWLAQGRVKW
jgi:hypothetical protein